MQSDLKLVHFSNLSLQITLLSFQTTLDFSVCSQNILLNISLILVGRNESRHFLFGLGKITRNFLHGIFDEIDKFTGLLNQLFGVSFDVRKDLLLKSLVLNFQLTNLSPKVRNNIFKVGHSSDNVILFDLVVLNSLESEAEHILVNKRIMYALKLPFVSLKVLI